MYGHRYITCIVKCMHVKILNFGVWIVDCVGWKFVEFNC